MATSITPGDWYLTVRCECGQWIVIDASGGPAAPVTLPKKLHLTCDGCGTSSSFTREYVRHSRVASRSDKAGLGRPSSHSEASLA